MKSRYGILMTTNIGMPNPVNHYGQAQKADCACPSVISFRRFPLWDTFTNTIMTTPTKAAITHMTITTVTATPTLTAPPIATTIIMPILTTTAIPARSRLWIHHNAHHAEELANLMDSLPPQAQKKLSIAIGSFEAANVELQMVLDCLK